MAFPSTPIIPTFISAFETVRLILPRWSLSIVAHVSHSTPVLALEPWTSTIIIGILPRYLDNLFFPVSSGSSQETQPIIFASEEYSFAPLPECDVHHFYANPIPFRQSHAWREVPIIKKPPPSSAVNGQ